MEGNATIRKLVGHPTSRQGKAYHINEKKRSTYPLVLSQAFENRKAIAH